MPSLCSIDAQRNALDPGHGAIDARQHQVYDVRRQVVLAVSNKYLLPADPIVFAFGGGMGSDRSQVRAGLRLGQVHGSSPLAADQLRQQQRLQRQRCLELERVGRAARQQRTQHERDIGAGPDLFDRGSQHLRRALAAKFRRRRQLCPAAVHVLPVGVAERLRHLHHAVAITGADAIAESIDRSEHVLREARRLLDHRRRQIAGELAIARQSRKAPHAQQLIEYEA